MEPLRYSVLLLEMPHAVTGGWLDDWEPRNVSLQKYVYSVQTYEVPSHIAGDRGKLYHHVVEFPEYDPLTYASLADQKDSWETGDRRILHAISHHVDPATALFHAGPIATVAGSLLVPSRGRSEEGVQGIESLPRWIQDSNKRMMIGDTAATAKKFRGQGYGGALYRMVVRHSSSGGRAFIGDKRISPDNDDRLWNGTLYRDRELQVGIHPLEYDNNAPKTRNHAVYYGEPLKPFQQWNAEDHDDHIDHINGALPFGDLVARPSRLDHEPPKQ